MDSNFSPANLEDDLDFGFAFTDPKFSDRILRIEIIDDTAAKDGSEVIRVKTIPISTHIFAAKSPFFYKLFSNGMRETEDQHVSLQIHASEEAAVLSLLSFMYGGDISKSSIPDLVNVLIAADKYEVASCVRYCFMLLQNSKVNCESALLFLNLPCIVSTGEGARALIDSAKQFFVSHYKDFTKLQNEMLKFPLASIEEILSRDDLQVDSEDDIYDFVLKWTRMHYPKLEDRKQVIGSGLALLVRFPFMSLGKLNGALTGTDFEFEASSNLIENAIAYKSQAQFPLRAGLVEREYKLLPIRVVQSRSPGQHCDVYLDIDRERCSNLFPSKAVYSQTFNFGGNTLCLRIQCCTNINRTCLGAFLVLHGNGSVNLISNFGVRSSWTRAGQYMTKRRALLNFERGKPAFGYQDLLGVTWSVLFSPKSPNYFVNGAIRLKVRLEPAPVTVKLVPQQQQQQQNQQQQQEEEVKVFVGGASKKFKFFLCLIIFGIFIWSMH